MVLEPDCLDLGTIPSGEQAVTVIKAQLCGTRSVSWLAPTTTCGCSRVVLQDAGGQAVKPGTWITPGRYLLRVEVEPRPAWAARTFAETVLLSAIDGAVPLAIGALRIAGTATAAYSVDPGRLEITDLVPARKRTFSITVRPLRPIRGTARAHCDNALITVDSARSTDLSRRLLRSGS